MKNVERFLAATRINRLNIPNLVNTSFNLGTMTAEDLPRSGYLKRLIFMVKGTLTLTDAGGDASLTLKDIHDNNPVSAFVRELRIKLNNGPTIHRVRGRDLRLVNLLDQRSQFPDLNGTAVPGGVSNARAYQFGTTASAGGTPNTVRFAFEVPFALNEIDPMGIIPLASGTNVSVEIDWHQASDMFNIVGGDTVAWTGTITNLVETFTVPVRPEDRPVITHVHQLVSDGKPITNTGEQRFRYDSGPIYLRMFHRLVVNGARGGLADITDLALRYNGNVYPVQRTDMDIWLWLQRQQYGRDLPQATFVIDNMYNGTPNYASSRDWIDSSGIAEFELVYNLAAGVVLGANNNALETCVQFLSPIQFN
jgi:hypothetical protein